MLLGEATGIDPERREVQMSDGGPIAYDTLVVATGARHSYFGNDEWARFAPGLKSIDDATEIRRRILIAFEAAEREHVPERRREWMTFVVVGGGPTGVELAGALGEIAQRHAAARLPLDQLARRPDHPRRGDGSRAARTTRPAGRRPPRRQLERLGVDVRTGTRVTAITEHDGDRRAARPAAGRRSASRPGPCSGRRASRHPRS